MNRDDVVIAFCRLRAHRRDAYAVLLAYAKTLTRRDRAAFRRDLKEVAAVYAELRPAPRPQPKRPPVEERQGRISNAERAAWRRYAKDHPARLSSHIRAL